MSLVFGRGGGVEDSDSQSVADEKSPIRFQIRSDQVRRSVFLWLFSSAACWMSPDLCRHTETERFYVLFVRDDSFQVLVL